MTIDLYTWGTPNGRKVTIALEEMGLEYTTHTINITKDEQFAPEFLKVSPNNKIPAIVDKDTGQSLMESGAILLYLADKTGQFIGQGEQRWQTIEWLMWQMGGVGPMFGQVHHFHRFNPGKSDYAEQRYVSEAQRLYGVLDKRLADNEFVDGHGYSIADMAIWPWAARYDWQGVDLAQYPNVVRWYKAIAGRDAIQRAWNVPATDQKIPIPA